jgi:radical SAM protein with 4Fe4S-binding SPASM domain
MKRPSVYGALFGLYGRLIPAYARWQQAVLGTRAVAPLRAIILLTFDCDCGCRMCSFSGAPRGQELTFDDVKRISDQLPGNSVITLTGGEPTVSRDFLKISEYIAGRHRLQIHTNGFSLDRVLLMRLVDAGVWAINLSLDAPREEVHDRIRGREGSFRKVLWAVEEIGKSRTERRSTRPFVQINTVILEETIPYLPEMVELCGRLGVDSLSIKPDSRAPIGVRDYDRLDLAYLRDMLEKTSESAKKSGVQLRYNNNLRADDILRVYSAFKGPGPIVPSDALSGFSCCAPWTDVFITPDGDLRLCTWSSGVVLGNIKSHRVQDLWNNRRAREFRRSFLEGRHERGECITCCLAYRRR